MDAVALCWMLATAVASGGWLGWFAGRRYEKSKAVMHRMRRRRPLTVNVDYDFATRAFNSAGYKVVPNQERLH